MVNNNIIILNIIIVYFQKIPIQSQTSTRKVTLEILRGGRRRILKKPKLAGYQ